MGAWIPAYLQAMAAYLNNPKVSGMYGMWNSPTPGLHANGSITPGEGGVDLNAPIGTPVYALADGVIVGAGYWNDIGHGVITTRVNVPGAGPQDLYYQHIVLNPAITQCTGASCNATVKKGQQIGTVGQYGETEMGFNAQWGGIWGDNHPAAWAVDPRPMLAALMGGPVPITSGYTSGSPSGTGGLASGSLQSWAVKAGVFTLALAFVAIGLYITFKPQIDSKLKEGGHLARLAAL